MKFIHYIITRFNIPIWSKTKNNKTTNDEAYLENRFYLFEKYCLPSIKKQTCQNFKWIILFDIKTPLSFKLKIEQIKKTYNVIIPYFIDINNQEIDNIYFSYYKDYCHKNELKILNNRSEYIQRIIIPNSINNCIQEFNKEVLENIDFIVTTRIDNDDAFHKDFIEIIQKEVYNQQKNILLDYINGYKYLLNKRIVSKFCFPNGHYTTLVEPYSKHLKTVLYWNHTLAYKFIPIKHIDCSPMYIELIHDTNVINNENNISLSDFIYALKHFNHSDFAYKGHCSTLMIIKIAIKLMYTYTKNYINYLYSLNNNQHKLL